MATVMLALAGCGAATSAPQTTTHRATGTVTQATTTRPTASIPTARPQAVEPTAGQAGSGSAGGSEAHAGSSTTAGATTTPTHPKITGPASVTSAPAKGAPSTAQVRAALSSLKQTEQRYQLDRVDYTNALLTRSEIPPGRWLTSVASFYGAPLFGNGVACGGILHPWTLGVANKTLPCGTRVLFQYGSRAIEVRVIDRGPYVAGREWDLTAATAVALHFPGLGPIHWRLVR